MIQRNNESVKYSLTDPKYRNPSIPCKFSSIIIFIDKQRIEDPSKLGPGAYNPNKSLTMKNWKSTKIKNPTFIRNLKVKKEFIQDLVSSYNSNL